MAVPTVPTISSIVTEGFRRAGIASPNVTQLARGEDEWFAEIMRDMMDAKRWKPIESTQVVIPTAYQQAYTVPSPLIRILSMRFFDGDHKGTVDTAISAAITLGSGDAIGNGVLGRKFFTTGGTGSGQVRRILSVSGQTVTVDTAFTTSLSTDTTYMIADWEQELVGPQLGVQRTATRGVGAPSMRWEEFEGEFLLDPIPDKSTYALEVRGQVDLALVDETATRYTRLLREWRPALVAGVRWKCLEDLDDAQMDAAEANYQRRKMACMIADSRNRRTQTGFGFMIGGLPRRH